jgi:N-acetylglucosaminyldiphosphoundecaprenol N-acetyl-beta-D-mannosaminyltransferase
MDIKVQRQINGIGIKRMISVGEKKDRTKVLPSFNLLGNRIYAVQFPEIIGQFREWINAQSKGHYVIVANTHVIMEARVNKELQKAVKQADMIIPDGMPLIVVGRMRGFSLPKRAYGPELMVAVLEESNEKRMSHFFYGSTPEVLADMSNKIHEQWPHVKIAGMYSPPFRKLTAEEDQEVIAKINSSKPDILWVGLGCPKQECWIADHQSQLDVSVMLGVGQAFDILAGAKAWAPDWMRSNGLEWLFRFSQEPRRLWKRYLLYGPQFIYFAALEQIKYWWVCKRLHLPNCPEEIAQKPSKT